MTTEHRTPDDRLPRDRRPESHSPRRGRSLISVMFIAGIAVFCFVAALPFIATIVVVALWGMGGSGSNK